MIRHSNERTSTSCCFRNLTTFFRSNKIDITNVNNASIDQLSNNNLNTNNSGLISKNEEAKINSFESTPKETSTQISDHFSSYEKNDKGMNQLEN